MVLKTWHKVAIAIVVPTVVVVGYIGIKKLIKKEPLFPLFPKKVDETKEVEKTDIETKEKVSLGDSFPLQLGSNGNNVKLLQMRLNSRGANLKNDSVFGKLTYAEVLNQKVSYPVTKEAFDKLKI